MASDLPATRAAPHLPLRCAAALVAALAAASAARADVTWTSGAGANGHTYRLVPVAGGITWDAAEAAALALGGTLATVTSAAENDVVFALAAGHPSAWFTDAAGHARGPWLGGFQAPGSAEPAGGWQWVNGEGAFVDTHWAAGQPNDSGSGESRLQLFGPTPAFDRQWNDAAATATSLGYLVEWQPPAVPEPRSAAMAAAGLGALLWLNRRRTTARTTRSPVCAPTRQRNVQR